MITWEKRKKALLFSSQGRTTWGLWTGIVLVGLSSLSAGHATKPRPQMTLGDFPWRHGLPSPQGGHAMAAAGDGSVWLHGGITAEGRNDQLVKLDPQDRRWHAVTTARPRRAPRHAPSLGAVLPEQRRHLAPGITHLCATRLCHFSYLEGLVSRCRHDGLAVGRKLARRDHVTTHFLISGNTYVMVVYASPPLSGERAQAQPLLYRICLRIMLTCGDKFTCAQGIA